MVKADRREGEREREIELGMKKMQERLMETREHDEHIGNSNQRNHMNQILSKTTSSFSSYILLFYRIGKRKIE